MDTSAGAIETDALGRRTGPRRQHTIEEKRRIVEETRVRGVSVAMVARRHGLNANQVFAWRQLYRRGLLQAGAAEGAPVMLPVQVTTPTVQPLERRHERTVSNNSPREFSCGWIEIELSNGQRIRVHGRVDAKALARVIDVLVRR